jgi:hypothetical protein
MVTVWAKGRVMGMAKQIVMGTATAIQRATVMGAATLSKSARPPRAIARRVARPTT